MPLLKDGKIIDDQWVLAAKDEPLPSDGPVLVPFERWKAERDTLIGRNSPVGVRLANTQEVGELEGDFDRFQLIVLEFPKFGDGRAYSQARLLHQRYGYRNELRASGDFIRDELLFLQRCGFDSFDSRDPKITESWNAAVKEFSVFYQPAADDRTPVSALRRRLAGS